MREAQCGQRVGFDEPRILLGDFGNTQAPRAFAHDLFNRHACAGDDGLALHDGGIGFDALVCHVANIACRVASRYIPIPSERSRTRPHNTKDPETGE